MAVNKQTDVGALIAEAVDSCYQQSVGRRQWLREYRALARKLIADYHYLVETNQLSLVESRADAARRDNTTYRRGYKTGWKRAKENPSDTTAPEPQGLAGDELQQSNDGFRDGLGGGGHAQQFMKHYNSGDHQAAATYALHNIIVPHYDDLDARRQSIKDHKKSNKFEVGMGKWLGLDEPSQELSDEEPQLPPQVHSLAKMLSDNPEHGGMNSDENLDDNAVHDVGGRKKDDNDIVTAHGVHPADFGQALGNVVAGAGTAAAGRQSRAIKELGANMRGGEARRGAATISSAGATADDSSPLAQVAELERQERVAQGLERDPDAENAPAASASSAPRPAAAPEPGVAQARAFHAKEMKPDLAAAAFGPAAMAAHQATRGDRNHPHFNPKITEFFTTEHKDPHDAITHAHEIWADQLHDWMRKQQDAGNTELTPKSVPLTKPIPGDPYGRHSYVATDGQLHSGEGLSQKQKKQQLQHTTIDPAHLIMRSLKEDPRGFGSVGSDTNPKAGWTVKGLQLVPGMEDFTTKRIRDKDIAKAEGYYDQVRQSSPRQSDPETGKQEDEAAYEKRVAAEAHKMAAGHPLLGKVVRPGAPSFDRYMNRARIAMHDAKNEHGDWLAHEGEADGSIPEHSMWKYNYGLATRQRQAGKGETQRDLLLDPPQEHPGIASYGRRGERRGVKRAKPKTEGYVRSSVVAETVNHMMDIFEQWLVENVQVPDGRMDMISEDIFSRINPTYGHLFEVEGG